MNTLNNLDALRSQLRQWRQAGQRIALVPTMGNLHAGHYSLIELARQHADRVVASIFVNPTQFGPGEDFERYPRTPEADAAGLAAAGCDLLWLPPLEAMYPLGLAQAVNIRVPGITELLDGAHRPGHFDGVATVVTRLFNQVQPDVAVFGRKDYQQLAVIRHLVQDLAFPIAIVPAPIRREADGLAMSSRNQYLNPAERAKAPLIHQTLQTMRAQLLQGAALAEVQDAALAALRAAGFAPDYAVVLTPQFTPPAPHTNGPRVALIAARLGSTRLIDNLEFEVGG
ncbi:pantoate--beta-alanine ligase [Allofranklinella schreckenbergeri]|uniref:Pantothenate synthetase n=1 Tax=Allofranklinella schreckenbergeri TaxID=1076744 RepID=A0A3M6QSV1_9BURK|nr:pantoate--beta-alanine ligase [Allofranklinella schreckenbergeri]RMX06100.1 pantoate--beta-alanine ligase [Allofranklinella schreckenbergeri]